MNLLNLEKGDTFMKGKRKRTFLGYHLLFVKYTTPSSKKITLVRPSIFNKWLEGAEKI